MSYGYGNRKHPSRLTPPDAVVETERWITVAALAGLAFVGLALVWLVIA